MAMDNNTFSLTWEDVGAIAMVITAFATAMVKYVSSAISDVRTRVDNERQRMDAIEASANNKLERIARMEAFMETYKADQARIENKLDQVLSKLRDR